MNKFTRKQIAISVFLETWVRRLRVPTIISGIVMFLFFYSPTNLELLLGGLCLLLGYWKGEDDEHIVSELWRDESNHLRSVLSNIENHLESLQWENEGSGNQKLSTATYTANDLEVLKRMARDALNSKEQVDG